METKQDNTDIQINKDTSTTTGGNIQNTMVYAPVNINTQDQMLTLPTPEVLAEYEKLLPGITHRAVKMAEKAQDNRHELEKQRMKESFAVTCFGQLCALVMGISGIAGGVYCTVIGSPGAGGTIATFALGTLAIAFLGFKKQQNPSE